MEIQSRMVLGKRVRRAAQTPMESTEIPPKRSRGRRQSFPRACEEIHLECTAGPSKCRSGLLTPEPSTLIESHVPTSPNIEELVDPKSVFPFMSLPAELRLHIYHMALVRPYALNLHAEKAPEPSDIADSSVIPQLFPQQRLSRALRSTPPPPQDSSDPIVPEILRLNKQIYKEARQLLYSENVFRLTLASGIHTLSTLHQRSRSLIKHVVLTIPSHHDILDGFADLVRLGLRYCWGLKSFKIILHASLPDDGRVSGATSVYANAFHILRWLPRGCSVVLEGCVSETVRKVVLEEGRLMNVLDETSYLKRQHQMPERH
ncbi:hypothetical protein CC86DRAFT_367274 [Ophiobolus disseminans]|uniref:DUF7730 domain-containing protein n=1 Tax=Ophiobolus disseminans TaxID=1469910 RepID=A0A6A7ACV9_9PLEO|nr:hypothetical protein CC86DRAFT_367274 [Ophiobolus disseminans]